MQILQHITLMSFRATPYLLVCFVGKHIHFPFALPHKMPANSLSASFVLFVAVLTFAVHSGVVGVWWFTKSSWNCAECTNWPLCFLLSRKLGIHYRCGCPVPFGSVLYRNLKGHVWCPKLDVVKRWGQCGMYAVLLLQGNGDGLGEIRLVVCSISDKGSNIACGNVLSFFLSQMFVSKHTQNKFYSRLQCVASVVYY